MQEQKILMKTNLNFLQNKSIYIVLNNIFKISLLFKNDCLLVVLQPS